MIKYKYNIMKSRDASLESISEESGFIIYLNNFLLQYRSIHAKIFEKIQKYNLEDELFTVLLGKILVSFA